MLYVFRNPDEQLMSKEALLAYACMYPKDIIKLEDLQYKKQRGRKHEINEINVTFCLSHWSSCAAKRKKEKKWKKVGGWGDGERAN